MATLRTRASKGSALTHNELDANFKRTVTQKTDSYQILISDNRSIIEANKATATTMTLPPVATADNSETSDFEVTVTNIGAGISTVDGSGAEAVDGGTGVTLKQWDSVTCQLDSAQTGWKTISRVGDLGDIDAGTGTFSGEVTGTGFTGTLDGILGGGTPAAASVTTLDASGSVTAGTTIVGSAGNEVDSGLFAIKATNETLANSTTLQADDDLTFSLAANSIYEVESFLSLTADSGGGAKIQFQETDGTYSVLIQHHQDNSATLTSIGADDDTAAYSLGVLSGIVEYVHVKGTILTGGAGGTFGLWWAQATSNATDTVVVAGSWIKATKLG